MIVDHGPNNIPSKAHSLVTAARLSYVPGLDGLRAIAVIAVLLYHADIIWFRGGYLGVDVFFVLSGYLITSLLLAEWDATSRVDLTQFWFRRARRLLPALFLLLSVVLGFAVVFLPEEVASLRNDAIAAGTYVTNWYLVFSQRSYFETIGRPSLFQHLWSLAVEEQFYLLWPLAFALLMRFWRRWALAIVLAGATASALATWLAYNPDVDPSRLYYGTDTRAASLLMGVALAIALSMRRSAAQPARSIGPVFDLAGLTALAAICWYFVVLDETQELVYRGGMLALETATAVVILALIYPGTRILPWLLGGQVLRWIGQRSYGIYLWHWPVFMVTRPELDITLDGAPLLVVRIGITLLLANLSYKFVEQPIRHGALSRVWRHFRPKAAQGRGNERLRWAGIASVCLGLAIIVAVPVVEAKPPAQPSYLSEESFNTVTGEAPALPSATVAQETAETPGLEQAMTVIVVAPTSSYYPTTATSAATYMWPTPTQYASPTETPPPVPFPSAQQPTTAPTLANTVTPTATSKSSSVPPSATPSTISPSPTVTTEAGTAQPTPTFTEVLPTIPLPSITPVLPGELAPLGDITAIGDSVMLGAARNLHNLGNISIDAAVNRQASAAIALLRSYHDSGRLGSIVVLHIGNNGTFTARQFDQIMAVLADRKYVIFVNLKVPRSWEWPNNEVIMDGVARYPNTMMIDWRAIADNRPELFYKDGYHLRPDGATLYTNLIADTLKKLIESSTATPTAQP
jgi:peptidoglycan/LPS O-acetylase OafA/YrhL